MLPQRPVRFARSVRFKALPYTVTLSGKTSHTKEPHTADVTAHFVGGISSFLFMLLSLCLIPFAGIQEDEALFSIPFFHPSAREFRVRIFHHTIPIMVMSYVGALKTWIYWPLVGWFGSSVWAVRVPMAMAGAVTVFLFYHLAREVHGSGPGAVFAAAAGSLLLATDPVFLLTNTFDWGPVALEHLFLVGGCFLMVRFGKPVARASSLRGQVGDLPYLAGGSFCFGLALWNKALFLWALSGLIVGTVVVLWPEVRQLLTVRTAAVAASAFLAGALPFVVYNLRNRDATLSENAHLDTSHMPDKWLQLRNAANGNSLFGYMVSEEDDGKQKPISSIQGHIAEWIWRRLGEHRETQHYYAYGLLLLLVPLWWRSRAAWFSLVFVTVAWLMMALTKNAGGAAHHDVLLWPFPILFAVSALAAIPWRPAGVAIAAGMVLMNLLVVNQYVLQLDRDGPTGSYTDALLVLNRELPEDKAIYVADWGMNATLELTHMGRLHLQPAHGPLSTDSPNAEQRAEIQAMLADSDALWLSYVTSREEFRGVNAHLEKFASDAGYRRELIRSVADSNGRPVFEVFRFRREL